jgi:hypothetical protein
MKDVKPKIFEYQVLTKKIVFVDGTVRVGKSMLCTLLAYLRNVSTPQMIAPLEQLLPMYATGHMDRNALSAYLRLLFNERFYNFNLSREANFRFDDLTSVHTSYRTKELFKNLGKADGQAIIDEMAKDTDIFQFMTHHLLTHYSLFKDLNIDAKVLELMRHPVDTVHSWYLRGWGERFDNEDPRQGTTLFKFGVKTIPHYALGVEKKYLGLNPVEKCLFMHNRMVENSLIQYQQLSIIEKSKILFLKFEDILKKPYQEIDRICRFIDSEPSEYIEKAFHDARIPRNFDHVAERREKLIFLKNNVRDSIYKTLQSLAARYESNYYDLEK